MRLLGFAFLAAAALSSGVPQTASAADIPAPVYKAAPAMVQAFSWTGPYVGVALGARWADIDVTTISVGGAAPPVPATATRSANSTAFRAGGYVGYNWQVAPTWLVGIEGDIAWGDATKTVAGLPGAPFNAADSTTSKQHWDASVRGRVGYLLTPTWLLYGTGGVAWQNGEGITFCSVATCGALGGTSTSSTTRTGWTVGGGMEARLWGNWLGRVEYRYADYGTWTTNAFTGAALAVSQTKVTTNTALVGLAYKF